MFNPRDNRIDYIELPGQDMPAMQSFYNQVCGWTFQKWGETYASFSDGRLDGGIDADPETRRPMPLVVLFSTDLEAARQRITSAGGRIVKDIFPFPGGRRFHFADPSGNELAMWSEK